MREDIRVCLAMYMLGYRFVSRDNDRTIIFHVNEPTCRPDDEGYFVSDNSVTLSYIYANGEILPDIFIGIGKFYPLDKYIVVERSTDRG